MTAQFGPHRFTAGEYDATHTDEFRGAEFVVRDLRAARFVDCDMSGVRIIDGLIDDVVVSGHVGRLTVNDVDVTDFVERELDRRHPERVEAREIGGIDDFRAVWATLQGLWAGVGARFDALPEGAVDVKVAGEWSFTETLRHLVFIADAWASRTVLDQERPFHPLGLPQSAYPASDAAAIGIEIDAGWPFTAVLAARADRVAVVRRILDGLTDQDLGRLCSRSPAPGYPEEQRAVFECLGVVVEEECDHYRFALRDLLVLEAR